MAVAHHSQLVPKADMSGAVAAPQRASAMTNCAVYFAGTLSILAFGAAFAVGLDVVAHTLLDRLLPLLM